MRWRLDDGQIEVIDDAVVEVLRHKTPFEKLELVFAANRTMRMVIEGALQTWHPDWSSDQIRTEVARRMSRGAI